jgi:DNA-binding MarR family transcriptional regulator
MRLLLMTVHTHQGITQKELSEKLHIAPSTSTRFVKKLELKKLVVRENERKLTRIYLTEDGVKIQEQIKKYSKKLHVRCSQILGKTCHAISIQTPFTHHNC